MNNFNKCKSRGYHKLIFEEDSSISSLSSAVGFLSCEDCGASSSPISSDLEIDEESIALMLYKEEQDELRAIDNDRIGAGLKQQEK